MPTLDDRNSTGEDQVESTFRRREAFGIYSRVGGSTYQHGGEMTSERNLLPTNLLQRGKKNDHSKQEGPQLIFHQQSQRSFGEMGSKSQAFMMILS